MTRSVLLLLGAALLAAAMTASVAIAEEWRSDAFGLYRAGSDTARGRWAGLVLGADEGFRERVAAEAIDDLVIFAGPKSQPAGKDRVHIVALGFDAHGNAVSDGTRITLTTGDGRRALKMATGGLADLLHDPSDRAASYHAGASSHAVQSSRAIFRVTADISSMAPRLERPGAAQQESFVDLTTETLVDRFGNRAEHGLALPVWIEDAEGRSARLTAIASGAAGRARLLTRGLHGPARLEAWLGDRASPGTDLDLRAMRAAGDLGSEVVPLPEIDAMRLHVGPFLTDAGHVLNDGALARIETVTRHGTRQVREAWIRDGMAQAILPDLGAGLPARVTVTSALGAQTTHPRLVLAPQQRTRE